MGAAVFDPKEKREGGGWVRQIGAREPEMETADRSFGFSRGDDGLRRGCGRKKKMEGRDRRLAAAGLRLGTNERRRGMETAGGCCDQKEKRRRSGLRGAREEKRNRKKKRKKEKQNIK